MRGGHSRRRQGQVYPNLAVDLAEEAEVIREEVRTRSKVVKVPGMFSVYAVTYNNKPKHRIRSKTSKYKKTRITFRMAPAFRRRTHAALEDLRAGDLSEDDVAATNLDSGSDDTVAYIATNPLGNTV